MGNANLSREARSSKINILYDDFRIVTEPPIRSTPVALSSRDGTSRRSKTSVIGLDDRLKKGWKPY